jgi:hypothetical protein
MRAPWPVRRAETVSAFVSLRVDDALVPVGVRVSERHAERLVDGGAQERAIRSETLRLADTHVGPREHHAGFVRRPESIDGCQRDASSQFLVVHADRPVERDDDQTARFRPVVADDIARGVAEPAGRLYGSRRRQFDRRERDDGPFSATMKSSTFRPRIGRRSLSSTVASTRTMSTVDRNIGGGCGGCCRADGPAPAATTSAQAMAPHASHTGEIGGMRDRFKTRWG